MSEVRVRDVLVGRAPDAAVREVHVLDKETVELAAAQEQVEA